MGNDEIIIGDSESGRNIRIKRGWVTTIFRACVILLLGLGGYTVVGKLDEHGDARWVQNSHYQADRSSDDLRRLEREKELARRLDEISTDVKTLLKERRQ